MYPKLLSVKDFAKSFNDTLGKSIGTNRFYELVKEEGFPSVKIGKRYYVLTDRVEEWLKTKASASKLAFTDPEANTKSEDNNNLSG